MSASRKNLALPLLCLASFMAVVDDTIVTVALLGVSSLVGGLAPSPWVLISARILQGVGAAAFVPTSLSLLTAIFAEGEERNRAIGFYGAMAALGFVIGMVGGGIITEFLGWRWILFVNVPV